MNMFSCRTSPLCRQEQEQTIAILRLSLSLSYRQFVRRIQEQWHIRVDWGWLHNLPFEIEWVVLWPIDRHIWWDEHSYSRWWPNRHVNVRQHLQIVLHRLARRMMEFVYWQAHSSVACQSHGTVVDIWQTDVDCVLVPTVDDLRKKCSLSLSIVKKIISLTHTLITCPNFDYV